MQDDTPGASPHSFDSRFTVCPGCGAPVQASVEGGSFSCPACGAKSELGPRDTRPIASNAGRPKLDEKERLARLGVQDGRPWLAPDSISSLVKGGRVPEWKWQEALLVWQSARRELASTSSPDAAERFHFLSAVMGNGFLDRKDYRGLRAFTETAFDSLSLPRHRQYMCSQLARLAVRRGDVGSAKRWISLMDGASDDLDTDSSYRSARALADTASADYRSVLVTLGRAPGQVPIADSLDSICDVLRANALEKTGKGPEAVEALVQAMKKGRASVETIARIKEGYKSLGLVERSLPAARARIDEAAAQRAAAASGGSIAGAFTIVGVVEALIGLGLGVAAALDLAGIVPVFGGSGAGSAHGAAVAGGVMTLMGIGFIAGGRMAHRRAQKARKLRLEGIEAQGRVISVEPTGTRIDNVPQFEISVSVSLPGKPPYDASTKVLLPQNAAAGLTPGTVVHIRVDPLDPGVILVETL